MLSITHTTTQVLGRAMPCAVYLTYILSQREKQSGLQWVGHGVVDAAEDIRTPPLENNRGAFEGY
jgi:hypothetical protein